MLPVRKESGSSERGFTLIELLVATAIFAIGMLGLAALQGQGLKYNSDAYLRSQAVLFASEMADRMRANMAGVNANNYAALAAAPSPLVSCVAVSPVCLPAAMAAADASEWYTSLAATLPSGSGSVSCVDSDGTDTDACTDGSPHTITVSWSGRFGASSYSVSVQP